MKTSATGRNIVSKKREEIKQETPFAYKGIGPVVNMLTVAGIARTRD